jgi:hypothetical protein
VTTRSLPCSPSSWGGAAGRSAVGRQPGGGRGAGCGSGGQVVAALEERRDRGHRREPAPGRRQPQAKAAAKPTSPATSTPRSSWTICSTARPGSTRAGRSRSSPEPARAGRWTVRGPPPAGGWQLVASCTSIAPPATSVAHRPASATGPSGTWSARDDQLEILGRIARRHPRCRSGPANTSPRGIVTAARSSAIWHLLTGGSAR